MSMKVSNFAADDGRAAASSLESGAPPDQFAPVQEGEAIASVAGVSYRYSAYAQQWALRQVGGVVREGQVIGLLGANGSGKSTFLQVMCGLLAPASGRLEVCGIRWSGGGLRPAPFAVRALLAREVAYCPEQGGLHPDLSPAQNGRWLEKMAPSFDMNAYVSLLGRLELNLDRPVASLSKGQRARVRLALALARRARLLLLDEPLSGLDPASRGMIQTLLRDVLNERRGAAVISTHEIGEIEPLLERVWVLREGRLTLDADADDLRGETGLSLEDWARRGMPS